MPNEPIPAPPKPGGAFDPHTPLGPGVSGATPRSPGGTPSTPEKHIDAGAKPAVPGAPAAPGPPPGEVGSAPGAPKGKQSP